MPPLLLRAEPLFVLTAMNASQHMTDKVLLGVFSFVKGGNKRKWTSLGCLFFLSQIKGGMKQETTCKRVHICN